MLAEVSADSVLLVPYEIEMESDDYWCYRNQYTLTSFIFMHSDLIYG